MWVHVLSWDIVLIIHLYEVLVEERMAERPCFAVGYSFNYSIVCSLFVKLL